MRIVYLICGFLSFGLAMIGIFVPLLPTTPLILLSAFFFARSSEKFHNWLLSHPRFGQVIQDWRQHGGIGTKAKIYAMIMIALSVVMSLMLQVSYLVLTIQIAVLACVSVFILTRPNSA